MDSRTDPEPQDPDVSAIDATRAQMLGAPVVLEVTLGSALDNRQIEESAAPDAPNAPNRTRALLG